MNDITIRRTIYLDPAVDTELIKLMREQRKSRSELVEEFLLLGMIVTHIVPTVKYTIK
jgi:hypothetical protein